MSFINAALRYGAGAVSVKFIFYIFFPDSPLLKTIYFTG